MYGHVFTSVFTVGFGGSVGLEGPSVATGSAIGSNIGQLFHLNNKRKSLLIGCGSAAALSALFNAPVAAVIFVLEIILLELKIPRFGKNEVKCYKKLYAYWQEVFSVSHDCFVIAANLSICRGNSNSKAKISGKSLNSYSTTLVWWSITKANAKAQTVLKT